MANNLRYLLEHFCLDGQKIDISSQLDEENANNIEKINTQTVPSINARIDDIKNTDIPNINSRIDSIKNTDIPSINQKINTINNSTIPSVQENVNTVNEKADRINESVAKNTRDIGTLSDNVTMQGNTINSINTEKIPSVENNVNELTTKVGANTNSINELTTKVNTNTDSINTINNTSIPHLQSEIDNLSGGGTGSVGELREKVETNTTNISINTNSITKIKQRNWELCMMKESKGLHIELYKAPNLPFIEVFATLSLPQSLSGGHSVTITIPNKEKIAPWHLNTAPVHVGGAYPNLSGHLFVYPSNDNLSIIIGITMASYELADTAVGTILYRY